MATLADIKVTLTLDTNDFFKELQLVAESIDSMSKHVTKSTQVMATNITQGTKQMSTNLTKVGKSSEEMSEVIGDSLEDTDKVLARAMTQFNNLRAGSRGASKDIQEQFKFLPRYLQGYVEKLKLAGKSVEAFTKLNQMYGKLQVENWKRVNDYMMKKTTESQDVIKDLARLDIQPLSRQFLKLSDRMEEAAKSGTALNQALLELGKNGSPAEIQKRMSNINKGIESMRQVFVYTGIANLLIIAGLVMMSNVVDGRLIPAFERLKATWLDALTPFVRAFTTFGVAVLNGLNAIGELFKLFAETHPHLSQMFWGFITVSLALTTLLAPLAVTVGLLRGMNVAWAVLWASIKRFVIGFLTVYGTAVIVAGAIILVVSAIHNLWKNSEEFRTAWMGLWNGIKKAVVDNFAKPVSKSWNDLKKSFGDLVYVITGEGRKMSNLWEYIGGKLATVLNFLAKYIIPVVGFAFMVLGKIITLVFTGIGIVFDKIGVFIEKLRWFRDEVKEAFATGDFSGIAESLIEVIKNWPMVSIVTMLVGYAAEMIDSLVNGVNSGANRIVEVASSLINAWIAAYQKIAPELLNIGGQLLLNLLTGIFKILPTILNGLIPVVHALIYGITALISELLPVVLNVGLMILTTLLSGITTYLPMVVDTVINLVTTLINSILPLLPAVLEAGLGLLMAIVQGILTNLPLLLDGILKILTALVGFIVVSLPMIVEMGMKILNSLIQGIVAILPNLINTIIKIITVFINMIVKQIPYIINAGVKLLTALVAGIVNMLPKLIATVVFLIANVLRIIISNLPKIIQAGIKIIFALVAGLYRTIPVLLGAIPKIVSAIFKAFSGISWSNIGRDIVKGITSGLTKFGSGIASKAKSLANSAVGSMKRALGIKSPSRVFRDQVGKFIPQGIAVGIESEADMPLKAMQEVNHKMLNSGGSALQFPTMDFEAAKGGSSYSSNDQYVIHATVREEADVQRIVDEMERRKKIQERSKGVIS